jgi:hypothetical protein
MGVDKGSRGGVSSPQEAPPTTSGHGVTDTEKTRREINRSDNMLNVPHSKSGIFPRSSLLGAGQLGFWEFGKGGTVG